MKEYKESLTSQNLEYLNKTLIAQQRSAVFQRGLKLTMVKEAFRKGDWRFLIRQLRAKLSRGAYYSSSGNERFINRIEDKTYYSELPKVAVYTCVVGNYDRILEPLFVHENIDYFIFTDQELPVDTRWQKIDLKSLPNYQDLDPIALNRQIKIRPHEYLKEYDYSLYIDGNIQIVSDVMPLFLGIKDHVLAVHTHAIRDCIYKEANGVKLLKKANPVLVAEQLRRYEDEGFPEHFGLFQNSILIRNHRNPKTVNLMDTWWEEYAKEWTRDQFSLPYAMWKTGIQSEEIVSLGRDAYENPKFRILDHR